MTGMLESIKQVTSSPALRETVNNSEKTRAQVDRTLDTVQKTLNTMNSRVPQLSDSFQKTSRAADAAATQARLTLDTVQTTIEPNSPVNYQVLQTLQDVSAAARSIKQLTDYLQRNPSAIIRGRDIGQD